MESAGGGGALKKCPSSNPTLKGKKTWDMFSKLCLIVNIIFMNSNRKMVMKIYGKDLQKE